MIITKYRIEFYSIIIFNLESSTIIVISALLIDAVSGFRVLFHSAFFLFKEVVQLSSPTTNRSNVKPNVTCIITKEKITYLT